MTLCKFPVDFKDVPEEINSSRFWLE